MHQSNQNAPSRNTGKGNDNETFASTTCPFSAHWLSHWLSPKKGESLSRSLTELGLCSGVFNLFFEES